jgi:hypothetical protein
VALLLFQSHLKAALLENIRPEDFSPVVQVPLLEKIKLPIVEKYFTKNEESGSQSSSKEISLIFDITDR